MAADELVRTVCQACHESCGIRVHIKDGKIVKIKGEPAHPYSKGFICLKGASQAEVVYHTDRLKHPYKRAGRKGEGKWQKISWDEALDTIAEKLIKVKETYGPESIVAAIGGFPRRNYVSTRLLTDSIGSPNWSYTDAMYCWGPHVIAEAVTWGPPSGLRRITEDITSDVSSAKCIIVWAGNPAQTHPEFAKRIIKARSTGAKVIVIDPRLTETASKADLWLQIRPGTDGALALGMLNVIISESLYDRGFIDKWCVGLGELKQRVQDYPIEKVAEITWLSAEDIKKAARMYATIKPAVLYARVGLEIIYNSTQSIRAVNSLIAITGNIDVKGGNIFQCFPPGFRGRGFIHRKEHRLPDEIEEKRLGAKEFPLLCGARSPVPLFHSSVLIDAILTDKPYPVKAMIASSNITLCLPDSRRVVEALKKLAFMVVPELFRTTTAEFADIVLPAAHFLEIEEVVDRYPNIIAARHRVIEPVGECWDELKIAFEIVKKMGLKFSLIPELQVYEKWDEHMYENLQLKGMDITFDDLKQQDYIVTPMEYKKYDRILTPSGKVELYSSVFKEFGYDPLPHYVEPFESPVSTPELTKEYPFILITGTRQLVYQHSLGHQVTRFRKLVPDPFIEMNPETAEKLGIKDGDWVWIETPRKEGRIKQKAKLIKGINPNVVNVIANWWYPEKPAPEYGMWESNINTITSGDPPLEPVCGTPAMRGLLCKIYKAMEESEQSQSVCP